MRPEGELEFRILGPLEVVAEGRPLNLSGIKQRALLAILLLEANRVVSVERLVELLWGEEPPETAPNVLQVYISQLRKAMEPDGVPYRVLISRSPGYLLHVGPDELDAMRFERLLEKAADAQPQEAGAILREALALWRGNVLAEFANAPFALSEASRLNELKLRALEDRIQADLELGQHRALVGELDAVVGEHPLRERFCGQLMLALYRSGRQAEASDVYQQTRLRLVEELGMEPGRDLEQLLKQILNHDRALDFHPRTQTSSPRKPLLASPSESAQRLGEVGTLTFLITDIEGSTMLWNASPTSAKLALERHDRIVLEQVEKNHGQIIESGREGDSVLAVFTQARDAVECAFDAQRSLQHEVWPSEVIRVRTAVHTGEAELRSGHYVGAPLYRCARLMATAHGGQVLLSKATEEVVADDLPPGISLRDLGVHRLPDVSRPEHVYQLLHPDLESEFPPLKTVEQGHNLPAQLTSFIGRQHELEALKLALAANRLVTLTGAGGCGKTRLAIQAAAEVVREYADGACFVDLSLVTDQSRIVNCLSEALGLREEPGRSLETTVLKQVAQKQLLLVVDNCEHVLAGCGVLIGRILSSSPDVHVLATSQEPLNVPGEVLWRVPSLGLPAADQSGAVHGVLESEAGQLFFERARLAKPHFAVDESTAPAVAQICRRLDGIPLAIELAAARIATLTLNDIVARLDDRFRLLGTAQRLAAPRQQTLLAAVSWSHDLLNDEQKVLFRRLSVFSGSFDVAAAEMLGWGRSVEVADVLSLVTGLVEKSLVVVGEGIEGSTRFRLLETLREFAKTQLIEAGEELETRAAHLNHYLAVARQAEPHLLGSPDQSDWLAGLDQDLAELRSALAYGFKADPVRASELATSLGWFWWFRGYVTQGLEWMEAVLAVSSAGPEIRGAGLAFAGRIASRQGAHNLAARRLLQAAATYRRLDNRPALAFALFDLGTVARATGHFTRARILLEASLVMWQRLGDDRLAVYAVQELGVLAMATGDTLRSEKLFQQAIAKLRASDEHWGLALNLGNLAELRIRRGDAGGARTLLAESLKVAELVVDPIVAAQLFDYAGMVAIDEGLAATGLSLFAAGRAIRERQGVKPATAHRDHLQHWGSRAERILGASAADSAWSDGLKLTFPAAMSMARSVAGNTTPA